MIENRPDEKYGSFPSFIYIEMHFYGWVIVSTRLSSLYFTTFLTGEHGENKNCFLDILKFKFLLYYIAAWKFAIKSLPENISSWFIIIFFALRFPDNDLNWMEFNFSLLDPFQIDKYCSEFKYRLWTKLLVRAIKLCYWQQN